MIPWAQANCRRFLVFLLVLLPALPGLAGDLPFGLDQVSTIEEGRARLWELREAGSIDQGRYLELARRLEPRLRSDALDAAMGELGIQHSGRRPARSGGILSDIDGAAPNAASYDKFLQWVRKRDPNVQVHDRYSFRSEKFDLVAWRPREDAPAAGSLPGRIEEGMAQALNDEFALGARPGATPHPLESTLENLSKGGRRLFEPLPEGYKAEMGLVQGAKDVLRSMRANGMCQHNPATCGWLNDLRSRARSPRELGFKDLGQLQARLKELAAETYRVAEDQFAREADDLASQLRKAATGPERDRLIALADEMAERATRMGARYEVLRNQYPEGMSRVAGSRTPAQYWREQNDRIRALREGQEAARGNVVRARTLNVMLNVVEFARCMQEETTGESAARKAQAARCVARAVTGYLMGEGLMWGVGKAQYLISVYLPYGPQIASVAPAALMGLAVYESGIQVIDAGFAYWETHLAEEEAAARENALAQAQRRNVADFPRRLAAEEAVVAEALREIAGRKQSILDDLERLGGEQADQARGMDLRARRGRLQELLPGIRQDAEACWHSLGEKDGPARDEAARMEALLERAKAGVAACAGRSELERGDGAYRQAADLLEGLRIDATRVRRPDPAGPGDRNPAEALGDSLRGLFDGLSKAVTAHARRGHEQALEEAQGVQRALEDAALEAGSNLRQMSRIRERVEALNRYIEERRQSLGVRLQAFMQAVPAELLEEVARHSARLQVMRSDIDAIEQLRNEQWYPRWEAIYRRDQPLRVLVEYLDDEGRRIGRELSEAEDCRRRASAGKVEARLERAEDVMAELGGDYRGQRAACLARLARSAKPPPPVAAVALAPLPVAPAQLPPPAATPPAVVPADAAATATVRSIRVDPGWLDLDVGDGYGVLARVLDDAGREIAGAPLAWRSTSGLVAGVDTAGYVTALAAGHAEIVVSSGAVSARIPLQVRSGAPLASCRIGNNPGRLPARGGGASLSVEARDSDGGRRSGVAFSWISSNPDVAAVNAQSGDVTTRQPGRVTFYAEAASADGQQIRCSTELVVEANYQDVMASGQVVDAHGAAVAGAMVRAADGPATPSEADGRFTALAGGAPHGEGERMVVVAEAGGRRGRGEGRVLAGVVRDVRVVIEAGAAAAGVPATAGAAADSGSFGPAHLFRVWEPRTPADVHFILYAEPHLNDKGDRYGFPDGGGGYWWYQGEDLGQYRDKERLCAVLRSYGRRSVSYNLYAYGITCAAEGPLAKPLQVVPSGQRLATGSAPTQARNTSRPARAQGGAQPTLEGYSGDVRHYRGDPAGARPVRAGDPIESGAGLLTGQGGQATLRFPDGSRAVVGAGSRVQVFGAEGDRNAPRLELEAGSVEVTRSAGERRSEDGPSFAELELVSPDASLRPLGTRYRAAVSSRGTQVEVLEGQVRLSGRMLARTDASFEILGKRAFPTELVLHAGDRAVALRGPLFDAPQLAGANGDERLGEVVRAPLERADPWNDPQVQRHVDEWLHAAVPVAAGQRPGEWRYSDWGVVLAPGVQVAAPPDHPAGWSRYRTLWSVRGRLDSLRHCTLGEFVERRISGRQLEDCVGTGKAPLAVARARLQETGARATAPPLVPAPTPALPGVLGELQAIPAAAWVNGKPDLHGKAVVIWRHHGATPGAKLPTKLQGCLRAIERERGALAGRGIVVVGLVGGNGDGLAAWGQAAQAQRGGLLAFPLVFDRSLKLQQAVDGFEGYGFFIVPTDGDLGPLTTADGDYSAMVQACDADPASRMLDAWFPARSKK